MPSSMSPALEKDTDRLPHCHGWQAETDRLTMQTVQSNMRPTFLNQVYSGTSHGKRLPHATSIYLGLRVQRPTGCPAWGQRQHNAAAPVSRPDMASRISSGSHGLNAPCAGVPTTPPAYTRALHPPRTINAGHGTSPELRSKQTRTTRATRRLKGVR
jgi:hypothetical protein